MKKIVIIGGGFAGAFAARKLECRFQVTLIDEKEYFEFTPGVLRTLVNPSHRRSIEILHKEYLQRTRIIQGTAIAITKKDITINHKKIPFDYLIIASGSRYNSPIKEKDLVIASRAKELQEYSQQLLKAKKVLIIGGGIVGVELAAEICTFFPEKKVVIVHSKERLMERAPEKAQKYAQHFLEKRKVRIIFNERITKHENHQYHTDKGTTISCDLAFLCTGIMPNHEHLGVCSVNLNDRKLLCVNEYLQVQSHSTIFAAGDITNIPEEKTAQAAEKQAAVVVKNIQRLEERKKLLQYSPAAKPMVISLGKYDGIFFYKSFVLTGVIPAFMKWFVEKKTMGRYRMKSIVFT